MDLSKEKVLLQLLLTQKSSDQPLFQEQLYVSLKQSIQIWRVWKKNQALRVDHCSFA